MVPDFPAFKPLEITDKEEINHYAIENGGYSDFIFSNVWSWDLDDKCQISRLNNNLVILFRNYYTNEDFLSFIGNKKARSTAEKLITYAKDREISDALSYIPEHIAERVAVDYAFVVKEDRNNSDYVYNVENIAKYHGYKYKSKRTLAGRFSRENPNYEFKIESLSDPKIQFELRKVMQKSQECKDGKDQCYFFNLEARSFEKMLAVHKKLDLILSCIYVDGQMASFSIDESLPTGFCLSHFFKVDYNYKGLYEFHSRELANILLDKGLTKWNWVEDLGIANLRQSKMSYRPAYLLKTYNISLK